MWLKMDAFEGRSCYEEVAHRFWRHIYSEGEWREEGGENEGVEDEGGYPMTVMGVSWVELVQ